MIVRWLMLLALILTASQVQPDITIETGKLAEPACSGTFVTHTLDHITTVPGGDEVRMFEANGGGVAINDLDNDGLLDIVLANHAAMNTILWNEGNLTFTTEAMRIGESRAVTIIDLDSDGLQDIIFTRIASAPSYWRNFGNRVIGRDFLPGISQSLYTINWGDLDDDGDLDLVGATYDAGLLSDFGHEFLSANSAGVYYYENHDGNFRPIRLADQSQALALLLIDLNADNRRDILVGNDFAVPDFAWYRTDQGWIPAEPFDATSYSTMSFDSGDVNNDGLLEVFSTDMQPYTDDEQTIAAWEPLFDTVLNQTASEHHPQITANVLQQQGIDMAQSWGVEATGWSWSGKFGDLDQDGFLDLYVVNGMMERTTFAHLPQHELVEENQAFRNTGQGHFLPAPEWNLNSTYSGRGMSMADLDNDGDLDIVVNNLLAPAQVFENQLCLGSSLLVDVEWPHSLNPRALGARLTLHTNEGSYRREIKAASGYLSGDPSRVHFGFSTAAELIALDIDWPDGKQSTVPELRPATHLIIRRT